MAINKNAYLRYQIIDECLTKRSMKYPSSEKLMDEIERVASDLNDLERDISRSGR